MSTPPTPPEGEPPKGDESNKNGQKSEPPKDKKLTTISKSVAADYMDMVAMLQAQTGIKDKDLEGMSPKQMYDRLMFHAKHSKTKTKNQKIIPDSPSGQGAPEQPEGISIVEHPVKGRKTLAIDPKTLFKQKK